ncbi:MAG: hypothetical protein IT536_11330 [Hyphomicrobiales bacterium]|nr:hypothetical protein [Hyphomicrobiales bacterium]
MAEITNELMYEVLKQVQQDTVALREGQRETRESLVAIRTHMVALQQDVSNIYTILVRHEQRLDRIERRLELAEAT